MPAKISIHVGLNCVDPARYAGWDGTLDGCHADALAMADLAMAQGYEPCGPLLLDEDATAEALFHAIATAGQMIGPDGTLLIADSGHGGYRRDTSGDEPDGFDETSLMFDREIVDDEMWAALSATVPHTATVVRISDRCHSATGSRFAAFVDPEIALGHKIRVAPEHILASIPAPPDVARPSVGPRLIHFGACRDEETAGDSAVPPGGVFTLALLRAWRASVPGQTTWRELHGDTAALIPKRQRQHPQIKVANGPRSLLDQPAFG